MALYLAISTGLMPCIAIHAGMAKMVSPSGMPCEKYNAINVMYLNLALSDKGGNFLVLNVIGLRCFWASWRRNIPYVLYFFCHCNYILNWYMLEKWLLRSAH